MLSWELWGEPGGHLWGRAVGGPRLLAALLPVLACQPALACPSRPGSNIVKYYGSVKTRGHLYIILEFMENGALRCGGAGAHTA